MKNSSRVPSLEIRWRRMHRGAVLLAIVLLLLASAAKPASAHAIVVKTEPEDMAILSQAPRRVRIWFSEEVAANLTEIKMINSKGEGFPLTFIEEDKGTSAGPVSQVVLDVNLPELPAGVYNLSWKTVSSDDLHATGGTLVFGVQTAPTAAVETKETYPAPLEVFFQWVKFSAGAVVLGALLLSLLIRQYQSQSASEISAGMMQRLQKTSSRLMTCAAGVALLGEFGLLIVQRQSLFAGVPFSSADSWAQILLHTSYGSFWLASQTILAIILLVSFLPARIEKLKWALVGAGSLAFVFLETLASHTSTVSGFSWLRLTVGSIHLLAAGIWAGGLLALTAIVLPLLRKGPGERAAALAFLRGFGLAALVCVLALAVTGIYMSGQMVASLDAMILSFYGRALIFKLLLVLFAGLLGLFNSASLHGQVALPLRRLLGKPAGWRPFAAHSLRVSILSEACLVGAVLLAAVLMGASQPARGPAYDPPPSADAQITPELSTNVADLVVSLSVKPDRPGQNFIALGVFDTRRPSPGPLEQVLVRFSPPDTSRGDLTVIANAVGAGHYQINGGIFDTPGDWKISVVVKRPGLDDASFTAPWTVLPSFQTGQARAVILSNQALDPWLSKAAVLAAVLSLSFLLWLGLRRWRRNRPLGGQAALDRGG